MAGNGKRRPPRPRIEMTSSSATPQEAAAIAAALERFLADTAPVAVPAEQVSRWGRAALLEGVERAPRADVWGSRPGA